MTCQQDTSCQALRAGLPDLPRVVLDTNVVLDWLLFAEPAVAPLAAAIQAGQMQWIVCARMRDELLRVLRYPALQRWQPDSERMLSTFDAWAQAQPDPPPAPQHWRCNDPDDQVFIDLARGAQARWLISHDRAVLALARRARTAGLLILKPAAWAATVQPGFGGAAARP